MRAWVGVALALAALSSDPPAAPAAAAASVARVDVFAVDARGRFVPTLTPGDFELRENGVLQAIDTATLVKADGRAPAGGALPPIRSEFDEQEAAARPGARLFGIFLDEYHLTPGPDTDRVRDALLRFVDRDLGPGDLVAVVKPLDSIFTIRLTRDLDAVRDALRTVRGRQGDYTPRTAFERDYIAGAPARVDAARAQVTMSALNALVIHLGNMSEGRKSVLLASEGLPPARAHRAFQALPTLDTVIRSASRYNVAIYPLDPAAADGDAEAGPSATLRDLAVQTDGRALVEADAFERGLAGAASDASSYYLLTYRSAHAADGSFLAIDVRVKKPGVTVRARKGYWAMFPDEAKALRFAAEAPTAPRPPDLDLPWHASVLIRPWFGLARGANGKTRITFVWEPVGRIPGDRSRRTLPARVQFKALSLDGTTVFDGPVLPTGVGSDTPVEDAATRAVFEVPPGRIRLRMSIEDAAAQTIDSDVREIAVRDLNSEVAVGSPEILRARNAVEFRALAADPRATPVVARAFSRTERLLIRFRAYAPGGAPAVTARLLSRFGQPIRDLAVAAPSAPDGQNQIDLPLAAFAPGEYVVEVEASSPAGVAKDMVGFRVTS